MKRPEYTIYESAHYVFHVSPGSISEQDIQEIMAVQEKSYLQITSALATQMPGRIRYWLCETPEEVGRIYGDDEPCNGFAQEPDTVYAVYNREIQCIGPHEDAHLISYQIAVPESGFLREGLAMYFDETWQGRPNAEWTVEYFREGVEMTLEDLFRDPYFYSLDCSITYPIAGAFTAFLIEGYGMERYLAFYRSQGTDWSRAAAIHFGCTLCQLEGAFRDAVSTI